MTETGRRALELRLFLERFVAERPDEPLAWIAAPAEASLQTLIGARRLAPVASAGGRTRLRAAVRASVRASRMEPAPGTGFWLAGDALFEADGVNHRRALEPIMDELGRPVAVKAGHGPGARRVARLTRRAVRLADELLSEVRAEDLWLAREPADLRSVFASVARYLAHAEALLAAHEPRAVAVASTTNIAPRALLRAAHAGGTPSVFFPHAPMLMDPFYNDLPVDRAGLRGRREVELFGEWGAETARLDVVGDPTVAPRSLRALDHSLPAVFAPPLNPPERLPALFELVHAVLGDRVAVAPHPRADRERLAALAPPTWELWERPTHELLEKGPLLLLQHSSGLALEGLRLGIPTIELTMPVWPTTYAVIQEPYVHVAGSKDELRTAVEAARTDAEDDARRARLRDWALGWSAPGEAAASQGAELVRRAAESPSGRPPIYDRWATPGAADAAQRLTGR